MAAKKNKQMPLSQLQVRQDLLELRPINQVLVNRYSQAMRAGATFPPIVIDQKNNIIGGNHRYTAYHEIFSSQDKIPVVQKTFTDEKERLCFFAEDNNKHGQPLSGSSRRNITLKLLDLKMPASDIARIFDVSQKRIEVWAGQVIEVIGKHKGKTDSKKISPKRGFIPPAGKKLSLKQLKEHQKMDRGETVDQQCNQLIRWLDEDLIDYQNPDIMQTLSRLKNSILNYLNNHTKKKTKTA